LSLALLIGPPSSREGKSRVTNVVNWIEVLPLPPTTIGFGALCTVRSLARIRRYGLGAVTSIHIIVKNGNVTLKGVVNTQGDSNIANIKANGVWGSVYG
jgi:hyperosmotically inducible periplasmic protein